MTIGKVYLVGAGPGDPELITVKGLRVLREADVIVYDRLAPAALLDEAKTGAERVDVGKLPQKHRLSQEGINMLVVEKAQAGLMVVRLKGGDPLVFGRGGEEALACFEAGVPFEIVPGISSAIAVPAYAGIPVTQRNVSRSFIVFTGHEDPDSDANAVDYEGIAGADTLVALMGAYYLPKIVEKLVVAGKSPDTPAACIEWGTTINQRVVVGTLATIAQIAADADFKPPSITVIGDVVRLRDSGMRWFD
jgi:uroporphyrinogen III methyltransferase/synthase